MVRLKHDTVARLSIFDCTFEKNVDTSGVEEVPLLILGGISVISGCTFAENRVFVDIVDKGQSQTKARHYALCFVVHSYRQQCIQFERSPNARPRWCHADYTRRRCNSCKRNFQQK